VNKCTKEEYDQYVQGTIRFLRGHDKEVVKDLHKQMMEASERLEFEKAADIYHSIQQIEKTVEDQRVDKPLGIDTDAIGLYRQGEDVALAQLIFRGGKLTGSRSYSFNNIIENDDELIEAFLLQHYEGSQDIPKEIIVPVPLADASTIEELLNVSVHAPQRGDKRAIIKMAEDNAESLFKRERDQTAIREKTLLEMEEKFHLARFPEKIECFDNSNIAGDHLVSAMVTFVNGQKESSGYRKFKIRTVDAPDDYGAMREVLSRRYKRAKEENNLPDLIIIDGGKGHLNIAISILEELDIASCDVIGVAKEEGRHDKGSTSEQVFLRNIKDPIILPRNSRILFLLQQIRDEAHRSAIGYHRKVRSKQTIRSLLEDVEGIGPVKQKLLLKTFGSVKGLKEATDEQILGVKGITPANLAALRKTLG
jgi:excinuclease ABC subunit C